MRIVKIIGTALLVLVGLGVVGAAVQFVQLGLPYLVIYMLGIEDTGTMNAVGCGMWLFGPLLAGAAICAIARACGRLKYDRFGVAIGVIAYPLATVGAFLAAPSAGSWVGALGYTSSFVAIPMSLGIGLAWLLTRMHGRRTAGQVCVEPSRGPECGRDGAVTTPRWRPVS